MFGKKKAKVEEQKPVEVKDDNARIQQAYYEAFARYKVYTPEFSANNIQAVKDAELLNLVFALFVEVKRLNMKLGTFAESKEEGKAPSEVLLSEDNRIY